MSIGRVLFLTFGCILLALGVGGSMADDEDPVEMQRAHIFTLGGIGLMIGGAACGAAERRPDRSARPLPPAAPPPHLPQGPAPMPGYGPQEQHPWPQAYDARQGHTAPYPPA
ncbi:hypothetical protein ACFOWE_04585 [Planomonospora corallina]|uniref:Uncharacterized protein n=1 Tax=Planomonospora corallina TaxID=1806052 RepID=A0ABV8I2W0_9ACTN